MTLFLLTSSPIGSSINEKVFLLTNQQVVLTGLSLLEENFSKEEGFNLRDIQSDNSFRRDSNPRSTGYGASSLSLNWAIWFGDDWGLNKRISSRPTNIFLHFNRVYAHAPKWIIVNNFKQNVVQNSSRIDIRYHWHLFDKKWHECYIIVLFWTFFPWKMSWNFVISSCYYFKSTKHVASINIIHSFVYVLVMCMWNII